MREFTVTAGAQTLAGTGSTTDLIAFCPSSSLGSGAVSIESLRFWVGQYANATSAQQRVYLKTFGSSFPTTTSTTPNKLKPADPNASILVGATYVSFAGVGINSSTEGAGATTNVHEDGFNVLNGWLHVPTPAETRIMAAPAVATGQPGMALCLSTVTTNSNWCWGWTYREI